MTEKKFSARQACTVLVALRLFQQMRPVDLCPDGTRISDMEHFESVTPLSPEEIDELCDGIALDWLPGIEADEAESLMHCTECGGELEGAPPVDGAGNPSPRMCASCRAMRDFTGDAGAEASR